MKLLVCIDDTDNIESKGTGAIADEIRSMIKEKGFGSCGLITRHQLLIHKDIPYTSHNSSMCFDCEIEDVYYNEFEKSASDYLRMESAEGSDPGICIAKISDRLDGVSLVNFGLCAKRSVLDKRSAYELAQKTGVFLKEEGGTGQGIIGALAGVGLRLGGNDGEVRGVSEQFKKGEIYTAEQLLSESVIQQVTDSTLMPVKNNERVFIEWKAKPIMVNGRITLVVSFLEDRQLWTTMDKKQLREFGAKMIYEKGCQEFVPDVLEEQVDGSVNSCHNCRYRKWTDNSFICLK